MKLMQVWVVCFLAFFGVAELYQWLHGMTLPMPVFVIAGALLAVASNANKVWTKPLALSPLAPSAVPPTPAPAVSPIAQAEPILPPQITSLHPSSPQLPTLTPTETPAISAISFTIQRSHDRSQRVQPEIAAQHVSEGNCQP